MALGFLLDFVGSWLFDGSYFKSDGLGNEQFLFIFFLSAAISFVPRRLFYQALSVSVMAVSLWFFGYYPLVAILVNTLALPVYEILLVVTLLVGYVAYALDTALPLQVISQVLYRMDQLLSPFLV